MTSFDTLINRTARKIEKDRDFFQPYNVDVSEAEMLIRTQIEGYIYDAIDIIYRNVSETDVDFYDYDIEIQQFNFDFTQKEIGLFSELMRQVYFERQQSLLKAMQHSMTPSDINHFSNANERKTFMDMLDKISHENEIALSNYVSTDRITGKRKVINHSDYDYEN